MYSSRKIEDLRPDIAANCKVFLEKCKAAGLKVLIVGTVRDKAFQEDCYRKGTSKTKVPSFHALGVGLAFDICKNVKGQEYSDKDFFKKCAVIGESMGFEWGGRWKSIVDMPHFQWSGFNKEFTSKDILAGRFPPKMPYKGVVSLPKQENAEVKHKVVKGDTLWAISKKYGVSVQKIAKDNGIKDPDIISIGKVLKLIK